ncbi:hypothetical protein QT327_10455 [Olivibacter sp. 47]|uniref:DUF7833 domain-containing protein n=1 Tax=Olivibacter sp. 47 TaxID=3056486 RepID=UPI0025A3E296|nr:hypothetical protein [Olivibacter sp. 47]MDM8174772.1 hypothetical protein [Olivibacter sp. 47]
MSDKLGFTFYPKDWWVSDSFFELNAIQRYIYLECLFLMYSNDGYIKTQKTQMENRIRTEIKNEDWEIVTERFIHEDGFYTHPSVNKRLRKTLANRENGKKGGRPPKDEKPKKPNLETQNNPPLERERERERENEIEEEREEEREEEKSITTNESKSDIPKPNAWGTYESLDDLKEVLQSSKIWKDELGQSLGISNPDDVPKWIDKFFVFAKAAGADHKTQRDAKSHCHNWIRRQIELGKTVDEPVKRKAAEQPVRLSAIARANLRLEELKKQNGGHNGR